MTQERGNILFLILLAVVLFAALSYALTSSMRGGGNNASRESVQSGAAAFQNYLTLLRSEIQRMMLVNGCTVSNLDWRHSYQRYNGQSTSQGGTVNELAPSVPKTGCAVFTTQGGPIAPQTFEKYQEPGFEAVSNGTMWKAGSAGVRWVNQVGAGTDASDIAIIFYGLNQDICKYIIDPTMNTSVPDDSFSQGINASASAPSILGPSQLIDHSVNAHKDIFVDLESQSSVYYCQLGMVLVAQ